MSSKNELRFKKWGFTFFSDGKEAECGSPTIVERPSESTSGPTGGDVTTIVLLVSGGRRECRRVSLKATNLARQGINAPDLVESVTNLLSKNGHTKLS